MNHCTVTVHWSRHQSVDDNRHHFVGSTIELFQSFAVHLQLHLRILLEDLRVALTKHLSHPLIGNASSTQPLGIRGTRVVNPKVGNLCSSQSFLPNGFEFGLMPGRIPITRKEKGPFAGDCHLALESFDGERGERNLGNTVRCFRIGYPDRRILQVYLVLPHGS